MITELSQKITDFKVWHIRVPVVSTRSHGIGDIDGGFEVVLLRLTSEGGQEGWGEAACWCVFTGSPEASYYALSRYLRPLVIGRMVSEREAIMRTALYAVAHATEAKAALESALLDLEGKILNQPVWALFGEKAQARIPLSVSVANPDFEQDKQLLEKISADGVRLIKLKTGFKSHQFDMMRCEYIRKHHPELSLRVDFNQGLDSHEGVSRTLDLATFEPDFIEQPVRAHDYDTMAEIKRHCPVLLLADESVFGPEDMKKAIGQDIAGGVSIKVMKSGGISRARQTAQIAAQADWLCYGGDMHETGLGHLPGVHLIASCPEITLGCEFYHAKYYVTEDILSTNFPIHKGHVIIPDGPGLGFSPDLEKIKALSLNKT